MRRNGDATAALLGLMPPYQMHVQVSLMVSGSTLRSQSHGTASFLLAVLTLVGKERSSSALVMLDSVVKVSVGN